MTPGVVLTVDSINRIIQLAEFALKVADAAGNASVKVAAIEAIAELLAESRKMPKVSDNAGDH
jgi:hypothetical protein